MKYSVKIILLYLGFCNLSFLISNVKVVGSEIGKFIACSRSKSVLNIGEVTTNPMLFDERALRNWCIYGII